MGGGGGGARGERASVRARMPSATWTSGRGCEEWYLRLATECARSTCGEETTDAAHEHYVYLIYPKFVVTGPYRHTIIKGF